MDFDTNLVLAIYSELSPSLAVGTVGVPVKSGLSIEALSLTSVIGFMVLLPIVIIPLSIFASAIPYPVKFVGLFVIDANE